MPDFLGSIVVFSVVLSLFLFSWSSVQNNQQKFDLEEQMRQDAYYTTTFLVSTPGYPEGWNSSTVEIPGFANNSDNVLSIQKIKEFEKIDYKRQRKLLHSSDFSLNISSEENNFKTSIGNYSADPDLVIPIRRNVIVEKLDTEGQIIWAYGSEPGQENNIYGINFTIQPGSSTIGNSLNSMDIEIDTSSDMISNTSKESIVKAGVDKNGDGITDIDLKPDVDGWETEVNSKNDLQIGFTGAAYTNPEAGDSVLIDISNITNPANGEYDIGIQTSGDGNWHNGTLGIGDEYDLEKEKIEAELQLVIWRG